MSLEWLNQLRLRLRALINRKRLYRDIDNEFAFHMAMREEKYRESGAADTAVANTLARRRFGNETRFREIVRDAWTFVRLEVLIKDIRYGLRSAFKNPVFAIVAILTLGLGIGANTTVFSLVDSYLLRPLPVSNPGELTVLAYTQKNGEMQTVFSIAEFDDVRRLSGNVFSDVTCYQNGQDGLTYMGRTEPVLLEFVSGNYFTTLGVRPALGRFFFRNEGNTPGADPFAVLGYSYWKTRFNCDPGIIAKQVSVNGRSITVIGVAPEGFHGIESLIDVQVYLPLSMMQVETWTPSDFMTNRGLRNLTLVARLKPGEALKTAQAGIAVATEDMDRQHPESDAGLAIHIFPERFARPRPDPSNTTLKVAALFLILAALVLVLACVNVGNLLLVRSTVRSREMALRAALGAGRVRLIRQMLTESALLACFGAAAGVLLGVWADGVISSIRLNTYLPIALDLRYNWRVFGFALGIAAATAILVGAVPALRASRTNLIELLREAGRASTGARTRLRNALVVVQISGSLMLLIMAGLLTRSLQNAQQSNMGFNPSHVLNLTMDPHEIGFDQQQGRQFYKHLLQRVRALPGVKSAATAATIPMSYSYDTDTVRVAGYQLPAGEPLPIIPDNFVSPGYFETMGIAMVRGRDFTERDAEKAPVVVIVNQAMADKYWHGQDPIGRKLTFADAPPREAEVIGVVKDSRSQGMAGPIGPAFFAPIAQVFPSLETLQVRTEGEPAAMAHEIIGAIRDMAPAMPVFDVQPMTQALNTMQGLLVYRFGALLAASMGMLGLLLAVIGVYGVVSYGASQRTQEIGVRMALGARPADIMRLIFGQGSVIVAAGLVLGIAAAIAVARLATNFLVGVSPIDLLTYAAACGTLALVALAACYIPAHRAMKIQVTKALRCE